MQVNGQVGSRTVLYSLILLIVPMVAFPQQFGTPLLHMSVTYGVAELAFYLAVSYFMFRSAGTGRILGAAAAFVLYRMVVGALLGVLILALYPLSVGATFELALFSYAPAAFLHVLATPFVFGPVMKNLLGSPRHERTIMRENIVRDQPSTGMRSIVISKNKGIVTEANIGRPPVQAEDEMRRATDEAPDADQSSGPQEQSGFERATRYLGENGSVYLAAVVDNEGLLLANFKRGDVVAEDFAPLTLLFFDSTRRILEKARLSGAEKIDINLKDKRIVVARDQQFSLMVLAERQSDDNLNIRIIQAMDMIRRYHSERYASRQTVNAERIHVSSTE